MSDQAALLAAIVGHPDDDTPRLVYADWLDEHAPDAKPSPAAGPSARAEYIRVQCRLARLPFDEPDYPELLEREDDLAEWLKNHTAESETDPKLPDDLEWYGEFDSGDDNEFVRGFPDRCQYTEYEEEPQKNIDRIIPALEQAFATTTVRTLMLEDAFGSEIAGVVGHPVAAGLRGLFLEDIGENDDDGGDDESKAVRAVATSPYLGGLKKLTFNFTVDDDGLRRLAKSRHLTPEVLYLDFPSAEGLKALSQARWFRDLRELRVWLDSRDAFRAVAELPSMPNLVSLTLRGTVTPTAAAVRKFVASKSFPRLAKLDCMYTRLTSDLMSILARGEWPLRHLTMENVPVRRDGAAALAGAAFADGLRVLSLHNCELTVSAVQALANSPRFANLRHLELNENPIGPGGLRALARSKSLRGLRKLSLALCTTTKVPINAAAMAGFLSALEMPDLRHLHLDGLPVGVRGGRALGGGAFRELTRLSVPSCGLRENGARAIVESAALPNLSVLYMANNTAGKGLSKLANPDTFPRLAAAYLMNNRVPKSPLARLRKRPGVQV